MTRIDKPEELLSFFRSAADFTQELMMENERLRRQLGMAEEKSLKWADRFTRIETQNQLLQNLFVVTHQLHATVDAEEVLQALREILANVVGGERFTVWLREGDGFDLLVHEGFSDDEARALLPPPPGALEALAQGGGVRLAAPGTPGLVAEVAMRVGETPMALVQIHKLLRQKPALMDADREVLDLLSQQGAVALLTARHLTHLVDAGSKRS